MIRTPASISATEAHQNTCNKILHIRTSDGSRQGAAGDAWGDERNPIKSAFLPFRVLCAVQ